MIIYILRKVFTFLLVLFLLSLISVAVVYSIPNKVFDNLNYFQTYISFFEQLFSNQLHLAQPNHLSYAQVLKTVLPLTIELCILTILFSLIFGLPLGIITGLNANQWQNKLMQSIGLIIGSCPLIWLAVLITSIFVAYSYVIPTDGSAIESINPITGFPIIDIFLTSEVNTSEELIKEIRYLTLPVVILSIQPCIITIQQVSQSIENITQQNYIKTARIREQSQFKILFRHLLPNAVPPILPQLTYNFTILLFSAMVVELIFNLDGMGKWVMQAFTDSDSITIAIAIMSCGVLICTLNLISELVNVIIHPLRHKELYDQ